MQYSVKPEASSSSSASNASTSRRTDVVALADEEEEEAGTLRLGSTGARAASPPVSSRIEQGNDRASSSSRSATAAGRRLRSRSPPIPAPETSSSRQERDGQSAAPPRWTQSLSSSTTPSSDELSSSAVGGLQQRSGPKLAESNSPNRAAVAAVAEPSESTSRAAAFVDEKAVKGLPAMSAAETSESTSPTESADSAAVMSPPPSSAHSDVDSEPTAGAQPLGGGAGIIDRPVRRPSWASDSDQPAATSSTSSMTSLAGDDPASKSPGSSKSVSTSSSGSGSSNETTVGSSADSSSGGLLGATQSLLASFRSFGLGSSSSSPSSTGSQTTSPKPLAPSPQGQAPADDGVSPKSEVAPSASARLDRGRSPHLLSGSPWLISSYTSSSSSSSSTTSSSLSSLASVQPSELDLTPKAELPPITTVDLGDYRSHVHADSHRQLSTSSPASSSFLSDETPCATITERPTERSSVQSYFPPIGADDHHRSPPESVIDADSGFSISTALDPPKGYPLCSPAIAFQPTLEASPLGRSMSQEEASPTSASGDSRKSSASTAPTSPESAPIKLSTSGERHFSISSQASDLSASSTSPQHDAKIVIDTLPEKYAIALELEGFTLDNITIAVKSVKPRSKRPTTAGSPVDSRRSSDSVGGNARSASPTPSHHSGSSSSATSMSYPDLPERMGKVLHLVADRWDDGAHFERRITFGQDADFSGGVRAKFDGKMLSIEVPRHSPREVRQSDASSTASSSYGSPPSLNRSTFRNWQPSSSAAMAARQESLK